MPAKKPPPLPGPLSVVVAWTWPLGRTHRREVGLYATREDAEQAQRAAVLEASEFLTDDVTWTSDGYTWYALVGQRQVVRVEVIETTL